MLRCKIRAFKWNFTLSLLGSGISKSKLEEIFRCRNGMQPKISNLSERNTYIHSQGALKSQEKPSSPTLGWRGILREKILRMIIARPETYFTEFQFNLKHFQCFPLLLHFLFGWVQSCVNVNLSRKIFTMFSHPLARPHMWHLTFWTTCRVEKNSDNAMAHTPTMVLCIIFIFLKA